LTRMQDVTDESRVEQLKNLLEIIAKEIDGAPGARDMASLAKQYREIAKEIEDIEGADGNEDEITRLLNEREADGKPRTVRSDKSKL